jgi:hypothetical protein
VHADARSLGIAIDQAFDAGASALPLAIDGNVMVWRFGFSQAYPSESAVSRAPFL